MPRTTPGRASENLTPIADVEDDEAAGAGGVSGSGGSASIEKSAKTKNLQKSKWKNSAS